jgi:hypothetical protein
MAVGFETRPYKKYVLIQKKYNQVLIEQPLMYNTNIMKIFMAFFTKYRVLILSLVLFAAILAADYFIHEMGHFLAALISGVPISEIKINFIGINPGLKISANFKGSLTFYQYGGGLLAAIVLLCVYLFFWFRRYRARPTLLTWVVGLIILGLCGEEIGNSLVEGHFHAAYMYYINSPTAPTNLLLVIFWVIGLAFHFILFPVSNLKKKTGDG